MNSPTKPVSNKLTIASLLVIALSTVIAEVHGVSVGADSLATAHKEAPLSGAQPADKTPAASAPIEAKLEPKKEATIESAKQSAAKLDVQEANDEAAKRKGRSEPPPMGAETKPAEPKADSKPDQASKANEHSAGSSSPLSSSTSPAPKQQAPSDNKVASSPAPAAKPSKGQPLNGKSGGSSSGKSKLPANLGTVTSTGSGGATHYMSKHDAYSAIAEKHGALAQDAMKKADKRNSHLQRFGGIQKASGGLGDMFSPFKGVTDSGLARSKSDKKDHTTGSVASDSRCNQLATT